MAAPEQQPTCDVCHMSACICAFAMPQQFYSTFQFKATISSPLQQPHQPPTTVVYPTPTLSSLLNSAPISATRHPSEVRKALFTDGLAPSLEKQVASPGPTRRRAKRFSSSERDAMTLLYEENYGWPKQGQILELCRRIDLTPRQVSRWMSRRRQADRSGKTASTQESLTAAVDGVVSAVEKTTLEPQPLPASVTATPAYTAPPLPTPFLYNPAIPHLNTTSIQHFFPPDHFFPDNAAHYYSGMQAYANQVNATANYLYK